MSLFWQRRDPSTKFIGTNQDLPTTFPGTKDQALRFIHGQVTFWAKRDPYIPGSQATAKLNRVIHSRFFRMFHFELLQLGFGLLVVRTLNFQMRLQLAARHRAFRQLFLQLARLRYRQSELLAEDVRQREFFERRDGCVEKTHGVNYASANAGGQGR